MDVPAEEERKNLLLFHIFFILLRPSTDWMILIHIGESESLLSLLNQMLISSRNILIKIPRNDVLPATGSLQFSSVDQSCPTLCDRMNCSTPGLFVHHQLPEFTQTHVHHVGDVIQPSHPLSSPSPPASNPSQHQGLFQRVNSSHEVAKVLEFQLQHQSFQ